MSMSKQVDFPTGTPLELGEVVERLAALQDCDSIGVGCLRTIKFGTSASTKSRVLTAVRFDKADHWPLSPASDGHDIGSLALFSSPLARAHLGSADHLARLFDDEALARSGLKYHVSRDPGRRQWGACPYWVIGLGRHDKSVQEVPQLPSGPFFLAETQSFFESLEELASWWIGKRPSSNQFERSQHIVIPDYRAFFTRLAVVEGGMKVNLHRETKERLVVVVRGEGLFGDPIEAHAVVDNDSVVLPLDAIPRTAHFYLIGEEQQYPFDDHRETAAEWAVGDVLLGPGDNARRTKADLRLDEMLALGESPEVEFKNWERLDENKRDELAETAVAFANARGGSILLGVDNNGQVRGIEGLVRSSAKADYDESSRRLLAQHLCECVKGSVSPLITVTPHLHARRGLWVLQLEVPTTGNPRYSLTKNGLTFIRRGATNTRATAWDAAQELSRRAGWPPRLV